MWGTMKTGLWYWDSQRTAFGSTWEPVGITVWFVICRIYFWKYFWLIWYWYLPFICWWMVSFWSRSNLWSKVFRIYQLVSLCIFRRQGCFQKSARILIVLRIFCKSSRSSWEKKKGQGPTGSPVFPMTSGRRCLWWWGMPDSWKIHIIFQRMNVKKLLRLWSRAHG